MKCKENIFLKHDGIASKIKKNATSNPDKEI